MKYCGKLVDLDSLLTCQECVRREYRKVLYSAIRLVFRRCFLDSQMVGTVFNHLLQLDPFHVFVRLRFLGLDVDEGIDNSIFAFHES